jgi:hypothetical protein
MIQIFIAAAKITSLVLKFYIKYRETEDSVSNDFRGQAEIIEYRQITLIETLMEKKKNFDVLY